MKHEEIHLGELILIGTSVRTNNKNEMNLETAKIGNHFQSYFNNKVAENFKSRSFPNVTYSVYTDYDSNEHGDYTHFIGEVVQSKENQDLTQFKQLIIPVGKYKKFTTPPGKLPDVVIGAWQQIWQLKPTDFGGGRIYLADFEVYDQKSYDPESAVVDVFISIK